MLFKSANVQFDNFKEYQEKFIQVRVRLELSGVTDSEQAIEIAFSESVEYVKKKYEISSETFQEILEKGLKGEYQYNE